MPVGALSATTPSGARLFGLLGILVPALAGTGCGVSKERALAEEKCSKGISDACLTLASQERDPKKADAYYRRACRGVGDGTLEGCLKAIGDDPAAVCQGPDYVLCRNVVDIYVREKRTGEADALLTRLCDGGDEQSCSRRDTAYWNQCRSGDPAGCDALMAACTAGSARTCRSLHSHYRQRCIAGDSPACDTARQTAQTGCAAGDEQSCQSVESQLQGECRSGSVTACAEHRNFTVEACSRGYAWACGTLEDSDRLACKGLDAAACSRFENACRMGASSNCESLDEILFAVCERTPAVCRILEERCTALNAQNLCSAAISGYATGCREGKGNREACDGLVDMCHRGNKDACDVAKLKVLT